MTGSPRFSRRRACVLAASALVTVAPPAWAGTYLNRAALLLNGAAREAAYLRGRLGDKELAGVVHRLAQARLATAGAMTVPKEVAQAHPHLLLVLENYEQATDAATRGELERFTMCYQRAQDEDRTFRAVVKSLGWVVPD